MREILGTSPLPRFSEVRIAPVLCGMPPDRGGAYLPHNTPRWSRLPGVLGPSGPRPSVKERLRVSAAPPKPRRGPPHMAR
jgi:hypothetical protein